MDDVRVFEIFLENFPENFIRVNPQEPCQVYNFSPSPSLVSWRTGMFLIELEMVSEYSKYPRETLVKDSARSIFRKLVKTASTIKVTSWSL